MQVPLETSFRNVPRTPEIEELILDKVDKLEEVSDSLTTGEVVVERPHKSKQSGNPYRVRLTFNLPPGHRLTVERKSFDGETELPLEAVVRDAFDALRRQLKETVERQRGEVKTHEDQQAGAVVDELQVRDGYGFLRTIDGRRVYFHANAVANDDFERLTTGCGVRFVEEEGEKGPQATVVQIVDKPGRRADAES
ncbi:HPF/RaiA family ribosome-associated protein [candidate division GN15 bacterium]|nr:HPF/RaiA family ribosome-associated protein [candidate division GN15 bacterium]